MKIIIGADFLPTNTNEHYFIEGDIQHLIGDDLCQLLNSVDYRIFNLEVPLTDKETPILKCGPNLIARQASIKTFKKLNVDLFTLANNHIMDQGENGLNSTVSLLKKNKIDFLGAADSLSNSSKPKIITLDEKRIGIYACVEHEFSVASSNRAGANPFNPLENFDHISSLKEQCDYVIVLYHGGKEQYRYPSPNLQAVCRKFVDKGADLVVCQHSHCIGCEERYNDGVIVYGQGNFLFDRCNLDEWMTSLLIIVNDGNVEYVPLIKQNDTVRIAEEKTARKIISEFEARSKEIIQPEFIKEKYGQFAELMLDQYLWELSGASSSIILRTINKLSGYKFYRKYVNKKYKVKQRINILNYFECEAHREIIIEALKMKVK